MKKKRTKKVAGLTVATTTDMTLSIVMDALRATGRIPLERPQLDLPEYFHRDNLFDLYLEKQPGGWVANILFRHVLPGMPNTVGTADAQPFPSKREAFLAGAALVCQIVTGSPELPFIDTGDRLVMATYGR